MDVEANLGRAAWIATGAAAAGTPVLAHTMCKHAYWDPTKVERAGKGAKRRSGAAAVPDQAPAAAPRRSARVCAIKHNVELCIYCQRQTTEKEKAISS